MRRTPAAAAASMGRTVCYHPFWTTLSVRKAFLALWCHGKIGRGHAAGTTGEKGSMEKSIRLHRGRSDGEGRNNPNHLGWFIGRLHAMAALDRNHQRTPACMLDACLSVSVHLRARFQFPKTRILPCHHAPLVYGMQSTRERHRLLSVAR